jgi:hypothetical protein
MKTLKTGAAFVGVAFLGLATAMAITNPRPAAYDEYATQQLTVYLKDNACTQAPDILGDVLQAQCVQLLEQNQTQLREFISRSTERQNFVVLSIYKTDLSLNELLPTYHFETVGVFQWFYTYKAERQ